ncbi:hypothetical protein COW36_23000 [bacterium (Candidatus Blackallbacteria) CG17_big_fil_post_rev_8_21_14_2_50_48_46]|uniref:Uncharacterized protein n=1 Tax=bacterium (Candidatus Blackallbacteria) CG17_big_fil_post_rev_8_21_14_2_50_48_46 TaxID=2014261 RepID=A0A2M7FZ75_9BACT|nr:MAG: hypothetical protein COW64_16070 [bacterium (Candidatus Blackallbacteria) CG18_big_fil_WC_8_21_14_2_50_49_26]PIW14119.1 MAG: hypothetical protein COW36_23000 [bacterium (Candidatus Blackallbacteria) CG17_big_fil_post_rev_8_21_14_2_50_48_46]PIW45849.1 MAG: hypothetical protein COW20_18665 [bacterium (Candidatus Blackallbacteria) CG13_big_fil_rev_8_21_14_2_50_49_14]
MPSVQQPAYNTPIPGATPGRSPVSPFARNGETGAPGGFNADSVQTQPMARGIQPNINLLHDKQSQLSPFHRPDGKPVDFLEQPATAPGKPNQPAEPAKIVFTLPKDIPEGPAMANIEQLMQQEAQQVQSPQQAVQLIAAHSDASKQARETSNRITWGARYYATQAAEAAEQIHSQWKQLDPQQKQVLMARVTEYRDQAVGLLNEAKKHGITTYNEALKANLLYNQFFTTQGPFIETISPEDRQQIKAELDDAWSRWNGSFQKEWQGQMVQAKGIMTIIDETSAEVASHLHRMNSVLSQLN